MKKSTFLLFVFFFVLMPVMAQKYVVSGKVATTLTDEAVEFAAAGLLRADSTLVSGVTTDDKGEFKINARMAGDYILRISYVGYKTYYQKLSLSRKDSRLDVGMVHLQINDNVLKEAVVKTTLARVEQLEDTTVFNAGAYRLPEGSNLEALVKLLPGVEVGKDGSVTWNGKKVSEFLVNGKDFFKGDNSVAMKNLPTDIVNKIKAYDKKSDYTEQTGIDDGEEKTVLDISTKRKLDESWISNIDLAYGTHHRYSGDVFVSRFTERSRISAYASLNNVDVNGYRGYGGGLTDEKSGGIDFSWKNDKGKKEAGRFEFGGSAYYSHSGTDMVSTSASETFLSSGKSSSFSNNLNIRSSTSSYMGANVRLEWNPDTLTRVVFRPSFSHNEGDNNGESLTATFNSNPFDIDGILAPLDSIFEAHPNMELSKIAVNRNAHNSLGNNESNNVSGDLSILRRLNSKGRNVSFRAKGGYRESESNSYSISNIFYFNGKGNNFLNQYSNTPSKNYDYSFRLGYAEPLTDKLVAEVRYAYSFRFNDSDRSRFNLDRIGAPWDDPLNYPLIGTLPTDIDTLVAVRDLNNSQYATYKYYDHNVNLNLQYKTDDIRFNVGVELNPEKTKMEYNRPGQHIDTLISRNIFQIVPDARFRYRFSSSKSFEIRYRGYSSQPSMTDLLAVVDNSNPLSVSMGNPGLKPSWNNSVSASYHGYTTETQQGIYTGANFSQTNRSVSNLLIYDETTGVRYMRPENINGNWNTSYYMSYNRALGKEKNFNLSNYTNLTYTNAVGYVSSFTSVPDNKSSRDVMGEQDLEFYDKIFANADVKKNTTRSLGVNERMRLNYRKDWFDVGLSGGLNYYHAKSTLQQKSNMDSWAFDYGSNVQFNFDFGLAFTTDIRMSSRRGYSDASMNTNELLWNAEISQSFLKGKTATISLKFYDILHEKSNVSRVVNAMMRNDSWTNAINSFCMLHFVYKLNIFPGSRGERENLKRKLAGH